MDQLTSTSRLDTISIAHISVSDTEAQNARRKRFDKGALAELAESVRAHGILQPIIVRERVDPRAASPYELVAGERRFLAAQLAELEKIPAVVRNLDNEQVIEIQLIENLQRADVHPMEEAEGYQQLMKVHGHPIEELHTRIGKSRSYVYSRLKLLALCKKGREAFYAGKISASIALYIARIPTENLQGEAVKELVDRADRFGMTARDASDWIQRRYMLRLAEASFPTEDAQLAGAGPCSACPKRTGNQPELFGDVASADVCTDLPCFQAKTRAYGQRQIQAARDAGKPVLTGKDAVKVVGGKREVREHSSLNDGYLLVGSSRWVGGRSQKVTAAKGVEVTLLQDPDTGVAHKVIRAKDAKKSKRNEPTSTSSPVNHAHEKQKREEAFRLALFKLVQPLAPIQAPTKLEIAKLLVLEIDYDHNEVLSELWQPGVSASKRRPLEDLLRKMTEAQLDRAITDMLLLKETEVISWGPDKGKKPERLLAIAEQKDVNVKALRSELEPKKQKPASKSKVQKKKAA